MKLKGIIFEDFVNYKKPCMTLEFPYCNNFKCGKDICQNSNLADYPPIETSAEELVERYINNPITNAVCFQGLEPFDTFNDLMDFVFILRNCYNCHDDIVIYTGYEEHEIKDYLKKLKNYDKIIIKFGRYLPNKDSRYDKLLGVQLASKNQYAKTIEEIEIDENN